MTVSGLAAAASFGFNGMAVQASAGIPGTGSMPADGWHNTVAEDSSRKGTWRSFNDGQSDSACWIPGLGFRDCKFPEAGTQGRFLDF